MRNHRWILIIIHATIFATFTEASEIIRCPTMSVGHIRREAGRYELSFIFYYTSWSNASLEARKVYTAVGDLFDNQFHYFAEVDCWHVSCNCTGTHEHGNGVPATWPTLIISFGRRMRIQYYGEWTKGDLIRFINRIYTPFDKLLSKQDVRKLLQVSDGVVLGVFPNSFVAEYRHFVVGCLQWLEVDPNLSFRCAAIFGQSGQEKMYKPSKSGSYLVLMTEKKNMMYDSANKINNSYIVTWLHAELKLSFGNMTAYNSPATLALLTQKAPVLTLIVNDMHLYKHYKNLLPDYRFTKETHKRLPYPNINYCRKLMNKPKPKKYCLAAYKGRSFNHEKFDHSYLKHYFMWNLLYETYWENYMPEIPEIDFYYFNVKTNDLLTRLYNANLCYQESNQLITPQHKMKINKHLQKRSEILYNKYNRNGRNTSLAIVIMNRIRYKDFVEKQGLLQNNTKNSKNLAIVAIFDTVSESVYMLKDNFTSRNIENFMIRYYKGELKRHMMVTESPEYHDVMVGGDVIFLQDFSRYDLERYLEKQEVSLVILFYGPYCGLSGIISNGLTQVANFLKTSKHEIKFGRFNIQENALPWNMEMPQAPVLAMFPKGNYGNSKIFPQHAEASFENIVAFIISHLDPTQQVRAILHSCKHFAQMRHLFLSCLEYSRSLVTHHISNFLKLWQVHEEDRALIMEKLKTFKTLGEHIQHTYKL